MRFGDLKFTVNVPTEYFYVVIFFYTFLPDQNTFIPDQNINKVPIMLSLLPNIFRKNDFLTQPHRNAANSRNISGFSKN